MKKYNKLSVTLMVTFLMQFANAQDTLTVMSYNILNYPISNSTKADTLKHIINYVQPDIFMVTELTSAGGASTILNTALNINGVTSYQKSSFVNGPDTDNLIYYNSDKLTLYSQHEIPTVLRNISEYVLYSNTIGSFSDTTFIYCYVAHLKALSGSTNENQRNQEALVLKNYMDTRINIENVFLGGDFNLYSSSEPAHNTLLNTGNVILFDPISTPGDWSGNPSFASIHTQSTRQWFIGDGGAFGGMDDRFDWIFVTNDILNGDNGLTYVPNSYEAMGNDGNHYNSSINSSPTNSAVPPNIADALFHFSDHLPIILKVKLETSLSLNENEGDNAWVLNFSNNTIYFQSDIIENDLKLTVYNYSGQTVLTKDISNIKKISLTIDDLLPGYYIVNVSSSTKSKKLKLVIM